MQEYREDFLNEVIKKILEYLRIFSIKSLKKKKSRSLWGVCEEITVRIPDEILLEKENALECRDELA